MVVRGCMVGGVHGWGHAWLLGACVVAGGVCMVVRGVCGCGGHAWLWGHAWLRGACMVVGGVHGCGGGHA